MKFRHRINPCDMDRYAALAPLGDAMAALWYVFTAKTDCPCCLAARLLAACAASFIFGWAI